MKLEDLLQGQNYNSSYNLITNSLIREYDLSKANINALYERGIISKSDYDQLYNSDKYIREKTIGIRIKNDNTIYKEIQAGIIDAKRNLILSNNIDLEDIVSIKNDAVFIKDHDVKITKFGMMDFKLKNIYTIFLKIDRYEFYYYYNSYNNTEKLDIKGIKDESINLHKDYFYDFLLALFNTLQLSGIIDAVNMIQNFSTLYINRQLEAGYYREFNSESCFTVNIGTDVYTSISDIDISLIDINYNYRILREIYGLLMSYYFKKVKE